MLTNPRDAIIIQGHQTYSTIPYVTYSFLFSYYCEIVTYLFLRCAFFPLFDFKNAMTLKIGLGVHQSLEISPFDSAYFLLTFYSKLLNLVSFLRYSMLKNVVTLKSGSLKVIGTDTYRSATYDYWFPMNVPYIVTMSLSCTVYEIDGDSPRWRGSPLEFGTVAGSQKTRMIGIFDGQKKA